MVKYIKGIRESGWAWKDTAVVLSVDGRTDGEGMSLK